MRSRTLERLVHCQRITRIFERFAGAGLHPILIKGWSTTRLYPEPDQRRLGDIDICLPYDEVARGVAIRDAHPRDFIGLDLHSGLPDLPGRPWDEVYARTQVVPLDDSSIRVLGPEDHLRLTCRHLLRHGARLPTMLQDVAVILNALPDTFDWDQCLRGSPREAQWILALAGAAQVLFDAKINDPDIRERARDVPKWLLEDLPRMWDVSHRHKLGYYFRNPKQGLLALRFRYFSGVRAAVESNRIPKTRLGLSWSIVRFLVACRAMTLIGHPLGRLLGRTRHRRKAEQKWVHY